MRFLTRAEWRFNKDETERNGMISSLESNVFVIYILIEKIKPKYNRKFAKTLQTYKDIGGKCTINYKKNCYNKISLIKDETKRN